MFVFVTPASTSVQKTSVCSNFAFHFDVCKAADLTVTLLAGARPKRSAIGSARSQREEVSIRLAVRQYPMDDEAQVDGAQAGVVERLIGMSKFVNDRELFFYIDSNSYVSSTRCSKNEFRPKKGV